MDIIYILKAVIISIVEGITEFIPVSSTGHMILVGWAIDFKGEFADMFEVVIQLGAILAVIGHPGGNQHTAGSPSRHPGDSIFNSEVGSNKLRNDEIKVYWKAKGERSVEVRPGVWRDPGPK